MEKDFIEERERPDDAGLYDWEQFEEYADSVGIGYAKEDWEAWWECWCKGHDAGYRFK